MAGTDLTKRILVTYPRLKVLSPHEMDWLCNALIRLADAGSPEFFERIAGRFDRKALPDTVNTRIQLLDLLAEVRTGMDLINWGFRLKYEAKGNDRKNVDFLASKEDFRVWIEVKRFNPDRKERKWWEAGRQQEASDFFCEFMKDDVRIGRLVREAAEKMPENTEPKVALVYVEDLTGIVEDVRMHLHGRQVEEFQKDDSGNLVQVREYNDGKGHWTVNDTCPLTAVILARPEPGWPFIGPIQRSVFSNPFRESESKQLINHWPVSRQ